MVQSLQLGGTPNDSAPRIRRVNRLPVIVAIVLVLLFLGVIF
jgi:type IV secretion system protein VirB10